MCGTSTRFLSHHLGSRVDPLCPMCFRLKIFRFNEHSSVEIGLVPIQSCLKISAAMDMPALFACADQVLWSFWFGLGNGAQRLLFGNEWVIGPAPVPTNQCLKTAVSILVLICLMFIHVTDHNPVRFGCSSGNVPCEARSEFTEKDSSLHLDIHIAQGEI